MKCFSYASLSFFGVIWKRNSSFFVSFDSNRLALKSKRMLERSKNREVNYLLAAHDGGQLNLLGSETSGEHFENQ